MMLGKGVDLAQGGLQSVLVEGLRAITKPWATSRLRTPLRRARDLYASLEARPESSAEAALLRSIALGEHGNSLMAEGDRVGGLKAYEESEVDYGRGRERKR